MTNTKKLFPIASVLFLLYCIFDLSTVVIGYVSSYSQQLSWGMDPATILNNFIVTLIGTVLGVIPFVLMAIFSLNTAKKPHIIYIIASALSCLLALFAIPGPIMTLSNPTNSENEQTARILSLVTVVVWALAFVLALIYAILIKASKKPSILSVLGPVFCLPFVGQYILRMLCAHYNNLAIAEMGDSYIYAEATVSPVLSALRSILGTVTPIIIIAAFVFVSLQFGKVNKNLASQN